MRSISFIISVIFRLLPRNYLLLPILGADMSNVDVEPIDDWIFNETQYFLFISFHVGSLLDALIFSLFKCKYSKFEWMLFFWVFHVFRVFFFFWDLFFRRSLVCHESFLFRFVNMRAFLASQVYSISAWLMTWLPMYIINCCHNLNSTNELFSNFHLVRLELI